mmetsp:Transcript_10260/g.14556  ORF Transcript_10260/g.14556 Transcript_10260/m.14556 type:complete len:329 (+) Transcript_10260:25-1011(+)
MLIFILAIIFFTNFDIYGVSYRLNMKAKDEKFIRVLSNEISKKIGAPYEASLGNRGIGGGSGASVGTITDKNGSDRKFFCKTSTSPLKSDMLKAEFLGLKEMHETNTVKVPEPICEGSVDGKTFAVFEYLDMGYRGESNEAAKEMGRNLAKMHLHHSPNNKFGFHIDNTIGATFQPNTWCDSWAEFWDKHRLGHMLKLCEKNGAKYQYANQIRAKVKGILEGLDVKPSLVHGDLWSGNAGFTVKGEGVVFDPATYYGHSEVDIAMTELFGCQSPGFYTGYHEVIPEAPGYSQRKLIYNTYHILNHYVLFGGGYWSSAVSMMDKILKMK